MMETVILERAFDKALSAADVLDAEKSAAWCLEAHGVRPRLHLLAKHGRAAACVFCAPDAEALRHVMREARLKPPRHIWTADVFAPPGESARGPLALANPAFSLCVVERAFPAPVSFAEIDAMEDGGCLSLYRVRFLRSYFARDRRRMLCLYEAPDAESTRLANARNGLPFEAVWAATVISPEAWPEGEPAI